MEQNSTDSRQAILKTSVFGGFDKKEVLTYIDRLRAENAAAQTSLEQKLEEVTAARTSLSDQVSSFEKSIEEMRTQLAERTAKVQELTAAMGDLRQELSLSQKNAADSSRALALQKEQNRILTERAEQTEERAKRYDDVSAQIGDIFLSARQNAGDIVTAAKEEASRICSDAAHAGERLTKELFSMREDLSTMREQMAEMVESFANRLDDVEDILDELEKHAAPDAQPASDGDAVSRMVRTLDEKRQSVTNGIVERLRRSEK